jgi:hypothetical protein
MSRLSVEAGNRCAPLTQRKDDLYETPAVAVRALLSVEKLPQRIWEPACGPGAIVRELRAAGHDVFASDLVDYRCPDQWSGIDFLMCWRAHAGYDTIVTNPPFKNAAAFVAKALDLCPRVIMLLRLAFLESESRRSILDNGTLARVHVFRKRLPMMHRAGWEGRKANSGMAFAWFVWDRAHSGPATLSRLSWEPFADKQEAGMKRSPQFQMPGLEPPRPPAETVQRRCVVCGQRASFGFDVRLREGQQGRLFCATHRPQQ